MIWYSTTVVFLAFLVIATEAGNGDAISSATSYGGGSAKSEATSNGGSASASSVSNAGGPGNRNAELRFGGAENGRFQRGGYNGGLQSGIQSRFLGGFPHTGYGGGNAVPLNGGKLWNTGYGHQRRPFGDQNLFGFNGNYAGGLQNPFGNYYRTFPFDVQNQYGTYGSYPGGLQNQYGNYGRYPGGLPNQYVDFGGTSGGRQTQFGNYGGLYDGLQIPFREFGSFESRFGNPDDYQNIGNNVGYQNPKNGNGGQRSANINNPKSNQGRLDQPTGSGFIGSRGSFVNSETTIQDGISRANSRAFSNGSGSAFASSIVGKDGKASADADVKNKPGSKPLEIFSRFGDTDDENIEKNGSVTGAEGISSRSSVSIDSNGKGTWEVSAGKYGRN